jgi:hypothetical protein
MDGASSRALGKFTVGGKGYRDGLYVAAADVDGDGKADIITGRDVGSSSIVEIFNAVGQQPMGSIAPFATEYDEGVRVAAVDVNFDGIADIIAASGTLNGTQVKVYDGRTRAALFSFVECRTPQMWRCSQLAQHHSHRCSVVEATLRRAVTSARQVCGLMLAIGGVNCHTHFPAK